VRGFEGGTGTTSDHATAAKERALTGAGTAVTLDRIVKRFDDVVAVAGVELEIRDGEFFSFLGPSGSGKTTCLRMIAGFEEPTSGRILLHGRDVAGRAPYERDVNTVFQDYALFPHMTVAENVGYGLRVRGVARVERASRVADALRLVRLSDLGERKPSQLSGGQRQRVALARALINEPSVLLLDEPRGALDLKLRQQMQLELHAIQRRVGITFIYVTHDQEEALTMSDRLAVFNHGRIEQVGTPAEVYEQPHSAFVAGFVGISNLLEGPAAVAATGRDQRFTVRPEKISIADDGAAVAPGHCAVDGTVREVAYVGMFTRYIVAVGDGTEVTVVQQNLATTSDDAMLAAGRQVRLVWDAAHNRLLPESEGLTVPGTLPWEEGVPVVQGVTEESNAGEGEE
jgi:putative spermidine/putrescine transport system ATP-binding protein